MSRKPASRKSYRALPFELYTTDEVAKMLQIAPLKLKLMRKAGTGPRPIRLGPRSIFYRMAAIEDYITVLEATGHYEWSHTTSTQDDG